MTDPPRSPAGRPRAVGELRVLSASRAVLVTLEQDATGTPSGTRTVPLVPGPGGGWVRAVMRSHDDGTDQP
jgi:hypothetical protein